MQRDWQSNEGESAVRNPDQGESPSASPQNTRDFAARGCWAAHGHRMLILSEEYNSRIIWRNDYES
jgi:hypothetical protein